MYWFKLFLVYVLVVVWLTSCQGPSYSASEATGRFVLWPTRPQEGVRVAGCGCGPACAGTGFRCWFLSQHRCGHPHADESALGPRDSCESRLLSMCKLLDFQLLVVPFVLPMVGEHFAVFWLDLCCFNLDALSIPD